MWGLLGYSPRRFGRGFREVGRGAMKKVKKGKRDVATESTAFNSVHRAGASDRAAHEAR